MNQTQDILKRATSAIEQIAVGEVSIDYKSQIKGEERLADAIKRLTENLRSIIKQALSIAKGNFTGELKVLGPKDELGASLVEMTKMLREMDSINKLSDWVKTGQAELGNLMKGDQDIYSLAKKIISYLCKYLGALIGTLYIVQEEDGDKKLIVVGAFAHDRRRSQGLKINFGEGLVGQSALEKEIIIFSEVPDNYININSSLGSTTPKYLAIIPVMVDNNVYGVLEIGSHKFFQESQIEFLRQVSNNIAQSIKTTQDHERIKRLLEESNAQTIKLRSQQDAIQKKNIELEEIAVKLEISSKYKSEFLANMSHELRTPLNSILILSENLIVDEGHNLNREQVESIKIIHSAGNDLLNLINDILDLSKVEAGKLIINVGNVNLKVLLERLKKQFEPIAKKKELPFTTYLDDKLWPCILTDGHRLEQILKNFLSNAFKFTDHGEVSLSFYLPPDKPEFVAIAVQDSGIGIKKEKLQLIFEAFQQVDGSTSRRFGGTGLGLSITRQLASLLECKIDVDSNEGSGSKFILYAPYRKAEIDSSEVNIEEIAQIPPLLLNEPPLGKRTLLLIDDDKNFTQILSEHAMKCGFNVLTAHNAKMGLDSINQNKPSAIILDMHLPDEEGNIILKKIKENSLTKHIPVQVISIDEDKKSEVMSLGACGFITKPVSAESLHNAFIILEKELIDNYSSLSGKKVLLVDDDMRNTYALSSVLRRQGLLVSMADNGQLALEKLNSDKNFDIIIMDIMMPIMDGYQAMQEIRKNPLHKNIPIIALTAKALAEDKAKALMSGANEFLTKPLETKKLMNIMNNWMAKS